jgi:hypothetical protein
VFGGQSIPMASFDFGEFASEQRKVIVSLIDAEHKRPTRSGNSRTISTKTYEWVLAQDSQFSLEYSGNSLGFSGESLSAGRYILTVDIFLDAPLIHLKEVPEHLRDSLKYSEVLNVILQVVPASESMCDPGSLPAPIYESYGNLGFFIADIDAMKSYVEKALGGGKHDLVKAFCSSELASELSELGVLAVVWGITPWTYYINCVESVKDISYLLGGGKEAFSGAYKLRNDGRVLSVVPGDRLLDWPACLSEQWPKLPLAGAGEYLDLKVFIREFDPFDGTYGPPLVNIVLCRTLEEQDINPLLSMDLESV